MKATAKVKNIRYGVRKLRLVADLVRGKSVDQAFAMLSILHNKKKGAPIVENALKSAVANFKQKAPGAVATEELKIEAIAAVFSLCISNAPRTVFCNLEERL